MGCDIHMYREVRDKDGNWRAFGEINKYYDVRYEDDPEDPNPVSSLNIPDTGRDYGLFSILSYGVRSEPATSIGDGRGLPEDVSTSIQEASDGWGRDGHSHSYATLEELDEIWQETGGVIYFPEDDKSCDKDRFEDFFVEWINRYLRPYAWDGDDSIRIVYWFDN